jgi:PilZ domain-containing protein
MRLQSRVSANFKHPRREIRTPMEVAVRIAGHEKLPGIETTFTQNVSSRGARVQSVRRWRPDDKLWISTLTGQFRSLARVAYCERQRGNGFAVGLEFLEPAGAWVVSTASGREETQLR